MRTGRWINLSRQRSGPPLEILAEKGTRVPPSQKGSEEWMRRELTRWDRLAQAVRRG